MSRDHQNDNAVWLCRFTKKSEAKKGTEQSAFEPTTTRSKVKGQPPRLLGIDECMRKKQLRLNHVGDRHGVLDSRSGNSGAGAGPAGPAAAVPIFSLKKKKKRRLSHWKITCRFCEACRAWFVYHGRSRALKKKVDGSAGYRPARERLCPRAGREHPQF